MTNYVKVLVRSPFSPYSGYGRDGIEMVTAMERAGLDVYLQPAHVDPPIPRNVAGLLMKELKAPFDIVIVHQDPMSMDLSKEAKAASSVAVGWTMWEYSSFDNMEYNRRSFIKRMRNFDLMLGYDDVTTGCYEKVVPKRKPFPQLATLQGGFEPRNWSYVDRDWSGTFKFFMLGQLSSRKDPFVAIQAYQELREAGHLADSELHLKNNIRTLHPLIEEMCPGIKIHYDTWSTERIVQFYQDMHMILAPSRGEGKNLPCLEFQCTGGVAAATNWGGMANWLSPAYAYPLEFIMAPALGGRHPDCLNARAKKEHLKEIMIHAYNNRDEVRQKGKIASDFIAQTCNWDYVVSKLLEKIKDLNQAGAEVYSKWLISKHEGA